MKKIFAILVFLFLLPPAKASVVPSLTSSAVISLTTSFVSDPGPAKNFRAMRIRDAQKLLGRKMTLKEKVIFKVVQWKMKKGRKVKRADEKSDKGTIALVLGILALVFLFIPYVILLTIPAAILAIILGNAAKKQAPS